MSIGGATPIWSTTNGTTFLVEDGPSIMVSPIAGGPFTLTSMDISEAQEFARAHQVLVTGIRFGGGINPTPLTLFLDAFSTNPPSPNGDLRQTKIRVARRNSQELRPELDRPSHEFTGWVASFDKRC